MKHYLACALCALLPGTLLAQPVTVSSLADAGPGSLRQAIADVAPGGTIVFAPSLNFGTIILTSGELVIDKGVTITGPGPDRLAISGNNASRVFRVASLGALTLHGVTVQDGDTSGEAVLDGGAILSSTSLTLSHCVVRNSRAGDGLDGQSQHQQGQGGNGGGIASTGAGLSLNHTLVTGNRAGDGGASTGEPGHGGHGGGIYHVGTNFRVDFSTVAYNQAGNAGTGNPLSPGNPGDGGGIYVLGNSSIKSSTISNNSSGSSGDSWVGAGGGVLLGGGTVWHSTITSNSGGGGLASFPGPFSSPSIFNSIVAGNTFTECVDQSTGEYGISSGYTLTTVEGGGDCDFLQPTNVVVNMDDVFASVLDPTLQNNGGFTPTHALLRGSPAVDQGSCPGQERDQRGHGGPSGASRIADLRIENADDGCDIGAFEYLATPRDLVVHFFRPAGWGYPHVYYFATTPDIGSTAWPGEPMVYEGCGFYRYRFPGAGMAHMVFNGNGAPQTADLFVATEAWISGAGQQWYFGTEEGCAEIVKVGPVAFLQGPYLGSGLMSTSLRNSGVLPATQPYGGSDFGGPIRHNGDESNGDLGSGGSVPATDWSIVELRTSRSAFSKLAAKAAIHTENGNIVDPVTGGFVEFPGVEVGSYFVVVRHRNHLPIMSAEAVYLDETGFFFDFTSDEASAYGTNPMIQMPDGKWALWAADANADGNVQAVDLSDYFTSTTTGASGYEMADFNMDTDVEALDFNLYVANKRAGASAQVPE